MCDFFKTELAFEIFLPARLFFGPRREVEAQEVEAQFELEVYERQLRARECEMIKGLQRTELALPMCPIHGPPDLFRGRRAPVGGGWLVSYLWWCGDPAVRRRRRGFGICACIGWDEKLGARCQDCGLEI